MIASTRSCAISMAKTAPEDSSRFTLDSLTLARGVNASLLGIALAVGTVAIGVVVGLAVGVASALLVFVTGALLGAILLVWHSLRTLAGDAEVDPALEAAPTNAGATALADEKRRALRALKDLEQEHAIGKIDDADFATLDAEYRARAKEVIREMDDDLAPFRAKAEALVRAHLEKRAAAAPVVEKNSCPSCETANDADATFCKKCGAKLSGDEA